MGYLYQEPVGRAFDNPVQVALIIAAAVIILICVARGYTKGAMHTALNIGAVIVMAIFVIVINPVLNNYLSANEDLYEWVHDKVEEAVDEKMAGFGDDEAAAEISNGIDEEELSFMAITTDRLKEFFAELSSEALVTKEAIVDGLSLEISQYIVKIVSLVLSILLAVVVVIILRLVAVAYLETPGVKQINKFLGAVFGFAEGVVITAVVYFLWTRLI